MSDQHVVWLWIWPRRDQVAWQQMTGASIGYSEYQNLVRNAEAAATERGLQTKRRRMTVEEMRAALAESDLPNTPEGRAAAVIPPKYNLGLKLDPEAVGWSAVKLSRKAEMRQSDTVEQALDEVNDAIDSQQIRHAEE